MKKDIVVNLLIVRWRNGELISMFVIFYFRLERKKSKKQIEPMKFYCSNQSILKLNLISNEFSCDCAYSPRP